MRTKRLNKSTDTSSFLGIGEGKRKRAKAEAEAKLIAAKTAAEKELLAAKVAAEQAGYKTEDQKKAEADLTTVAIEAESSNTLYYILGAVVIAVMIGLYFITRKK